MAWIRTVGPNDAEAPLREIYARVVGASGEVASILEVQSLHAAALREHYQLYRTLMFGPSPLSRAERESIAVVVSAENGCHY